MKRIGGPGAVVLYNGQLARVVGIAEGRTIIMDLIESPTCQACGARPNVSLLEHSPLFQESVQPVETAAETVPV